MDVLFVFAAGVVGFVLGWLYAIGTIMVSTRRRVVIDMRIHAGGIEIERNDSDDPDQWLAPSECDHEWVDASNQAVDSGHVCFKCGAIRGVDNE